MVENVTLNSVNYLIKSYFNQDDISKVSMEKIVSYVELYPYDAVYRLIYLIKVVELSKTKSNYSLTIKKELEKNLIYFKNSLWLSYIMNLFEDFLLITNTNYQKKIENKIQKNKLRKKSKIDKVVKKGSFKNNSGDERKEKKKKELPIEEKQINEAGTNAHNSKTIKSEKVEEIKSIPHSENIHVSVAPPNSNKQFSDWLLYITQGTKRKISEIETNADDIDKTEPIYTETMAKLYEKQNNIDKAIFVYKQLTFQKPDKKNYFQKKIESLLTLKND